VLGINDEPVTIRENELAVIEYAFREGLVRPFIPLRRTGKRVAVIGSGPAGLSCAEQLNKAGHSVSVFEKEDRIGGIMRYGIPDFKLEKRILDRRIKILEEGGIVFNAGICVGKDYDVKKLRREFDALCLAGGCGVPRDLKIEGRELKGIYFAMDYLARANRKAAGEKVCDDGFIDAKGKRVVVIGGGDTGADCVGVANRQGASCVVQIELLPQPPGCRGPEYPWPKYPLLLRSSSSHEEGARREWSVLTKRFIGEKGRLKKLSCAKVKCEEEAPESAFEIEAELVILAMGFLRPEKNGLIEALELELDPRGNIKTGDNLMTSVNGVFSAGDMRRGQSLVVWAISEGRRAAYCMDTYLTGSSFLPVI
jgi:glutamate synthase (NADPH/NADH) small chain